MVALTGTLTLDRTSVAVPGKDLSVVANYLNAGTAGALNSSGGSQPKQEEVDLGGSFRSYANGTTRLISTPTKTRTQTLAFRQLTKDEKDALLGMAGKTLVFRDTYGRKVFGSFLNVTVQAIPLSPYFDAGITFTETSYSEVV